MKTPGHRDETTVVGYLPSVTAGEWPVAEGWWVRDKEHLLHHEKAFNMPLPESIKPRELEEQVVKAGEVSKNWQAEGGTEDQLAGDMRTDLQRLKLDNADST